MTEYFKSKVRKYGPLLMGEFDLSVEDCAAVFGNLGHESMGFKAMQEKKPLIPGSKGGFGWAQWTGPRRRTFEAWCKKNKLAPTSDDGNFGYLLYELHNTEKTAIPRTKRAKTLTDKVIAFELGFERAGIKHYPSRNTWAKEALGVLQPVKIASLLDETQDENPGDDVAEPPHGQDTDQIAWVQEELLKVGYYEIGIVDGKWGGGTAAAIAAYSNDRHLNSTFVIDEQLIDDIKSLPAGWTRPIADIRETTKARDLEQSMPVAKQTRIGRLWAKISTYIFGGTVTAGAITDASDTVKSKVMPLYETVSSNVPTLLTKWWFWGALVALGAGAFWRVLRYSATEAPIEKAYQERRLLS